MRPAPVKKEDPEEDNKPPEYALLAMDKIEQQLWFCRLPDFLYRELGKITTRTEIGKIRLETPPSGPPRASIIFNANATVTIPFSKLPDEFQVEIDPDNPANQYVFTNAKTTGTVRIVGRVICTARLHSDDFVKMTQCRNYVQSEATPKKQAKHKMMLDALPEEAKPDAPVAWRTQKKEKKDKRLRMSENEVRLSILSLFKENPEWRLKDMAERINQAQEYVRKTLTEVADYHQNTAMWTLKSSHRALEEDD
jgi:hypothetical protein